MVSVSFFIFVWSWCHCVVNRYYHVTLFFQYMKVIGVILLNFNGMSIWNIIGAKIYFKFSFFWIFDFKWVTKWVDASKIILLFLSSENSNTKTVIQNEWQICLKQLPRFFWGCRHLFRRGSFMCGFCYCYCSAHVRCACVCNIFMDSIKMKLHATGSICKLGASYTQCANCVQWYVLKTT